MLPRKFISIHCLENESNELKDSNIERTENFPHFPRRSESDTDCSDVGESSEKRLVCLVVKPVCEVRKGSAERVVVPKLPNVVEGVHGDSHDGTQIIVSHLLGESSEVLDDSGLLQLIENVPVQFETGLEEERSCAVARGVSFGPITESVTFWTMLWTWREAIGLRRHQKVLFMRVVNGELKSLRLKQNVCCVLRLLPLKMETGAMKEIWRFEVILGE